MADLVIILAAALIGGLLTHHLRQPILLGYLLGGIVIGPFALGWVQDLAAVETLATVGVVLLLFALGMEFSLGELRRLGRIGVGGGVAQILATALLGLAIGRFLLHWSWTEAIFFGLLISLSSTMIVLKSLAERGEIDSVQGRIMIGILLVQDLSVAPMMVILPSLGQEEGVGVALGMAALKAGVFLGVIVIIGLWVLPRLLRRTAELRSRELFLLAVITLGLGAAAGTQVFGLSLAFGAFVAGLVVGQSQFAHQALADVIPLRDTFAALFFVSLGMLTDPAFIAQNLSVVLLVAGAIVLGKFLILFLLARLFGYSLKTGLFVGVGLIQIGEFSFVLARAGLNSGVISEYLYSLTLASALITILLTPIAMSLASALYTRLERIEGLAPLLTASGQSILKEEDIDLSNHVVICGHGRVGRNLSLVLEEHHVPYVVIDLNPQVISELRERGVPAIYGDASNPVVLSRSLIPKARVLVLSYPDPLALIGAATNALKINPDLDIVARVHRDSEAELLERLNITELVRPEFEAGLEIIRHTMRCYGMGFTQIQHIVHGLREELMADFEHRDPEP
ncbi:MAG: cation:proton antiporter [Dehalococcoidia bacterium]